MLFVKTKLQMNEAVSFYKFFFTKKKLFCDSLVVILDVLTGTVFGLKTF